MSQKLFSVAEANRLLPVLRPILSDLKQEWEFMQAIGEEIRRASERSDQGGGTLFGSSYIQAAELVVHQLHRIQEMGVLVKDPAMGLCDFPHRRGDRLVYLCWRLGESRVAWWHDVEAGYSGREPLEDPET